jgi:mRNA interferase MazF
MQSNHTEDLPAVILLLFTTGLDSAKSVRVDILPDDHNGLREASDLMVDIPVTARREKVGAVIGALSPAAMTRAESALLLMLGFA